MNRNIARVFLSLSLSLLSPPLPAQEQGVGAAPDLTEETIRARLREVETGNAANQASAENVGELYKRALADIQRARIFAGTAGSHADLRETAPAEIKRLGVTLERETRAAAKKRPIAANLSLGQLEQRYSAAKADLVAAETMLDDLGKSLELQDRRPAEIRDRLVAAGKRLDALDDELAAAQDADPPPLAEARRLALQAQTQALGAETKMLEQEQLSHPIAVELLQAKYGLAALRVETITARVRELEDLMNKKRLREAEAVRTQVMAANEDLRDKHPAHRELAAKNVALGEALRERALNLESVTAANDIARDKTRRITEDLNTTKQKLEVAGLSQGLGRVLMEQRRELPPLSDLREDAARYERLIAESGLRKIQYDEERRDLRDIDEYVAALTPDLDGKEGDAVRRELRGLAVTHNDLLGRAAATEAAYLRALGEIDLANRALMNVVESYDSYLGKRLLWIRNTERIDLSYFGDMLREAGRLLNPAHWLRLARDIYRQFELRPLTIPAAFLFVAMLFTRRRCLAAAVAIGEQTRRIRTDNFWLTVQTLAWTALAALPLPLLIGYLAWLILSAPGSAEFSRAAASGMLQAAQQLIFLLPFADLARRGGLVERHFRWREDVTAKIRREIKLLMATLLPPAFIAEYQFALDKSGFGGGLGALAVTMVTAAAALFIFRAFTPDGGVLKHYLAARPRGFMSRYRALWLGWPLFVLCVMPLFALSGYMYTVNTLMHNFILSAWMVYLLVLTRGLVLRWLLVVRRRLAFIAAIERREAARQSRETGKAEPLTESHVEINEPEVDLGALNSDSRKLTDTVAIILGLVALWFIWSPLLPAFGILEDIELWTRAELVGGVETQVPVTLADMALAIIIAAASWSAVRGLPALLEFILLERTAITRGGIFTAKTLLRYTLSAIGIIAIFQILGGSWGQIQWLVAALGVGIGFGLQEIVANFISGLIILFERPIRVGDTVTVGDVHGVVSRIEIRATTITNWDNQELLVPNKEFITGRLLNWSLSDPIIRVAVPVGIAYGSDVAKAMKILKQIADEHPVALAEPAPLITFESFGDNALGLYLRVFIPSIEYKLVTVSELHQIINDKFNEAGIVVAFPQRDVHLEQSRPLEVRVRMGDDKRRPGKP